MGAALENVEDVSPCIAGDLEELQQKDAVKLRICSLSLSLSCSLLPSVRLHGLPHREPMCCMQEGEGQTRLCLDRLQLEAIHKVGTLPLNSSQLWSLGAMKSESEKVTEMAARETALHTLILQSTTNTSFMVFLSCFHPIMVLFFLGLRSLLLLLELGLTLKYQL